MPSMNSGEKIKRQSELVFSGGALMRLADALDAVAGVVGVLIRRRDEMANLIASWSQRSKQVRLQIDDLTDFKFMRH